MSAPRTFVACYRRISNPTLDGTNPKMRDPTANQGVGVIEFKYVTSIKISLPNDEVLNGHPLWERGMEFCRAHLVENSP